MWLLPIIAYAENTDPATKAANAADIMTAAESAAWALAHTDPASLALAA
jgi:hypothetical protein